MHSSNISTVIGQMLLAQARRSLEHAATRQELLKIKPADFPAALQQKGATFVTLEKQGDLRGCVGSLEAAAPLIEDVTLNAFYAALHDHRFQPVRGHELDSLQVSVSVLTVATELTFTSEADLLQQIRPNIDGLILEAFGQRGTFLPAVWESLPDVELFLRHLKIKAGFAPDFWDKSIKIYRYTTDKFSEAKDE